MHITTNHKQVADGERLTVIIDGEPLYEIGYTTGDETAPAPSVHVLNVETGETLEDEVI